MILASILKHKDGWRALVNRKGVRESRVFDTKRAAQDWANQREYEILNAGPPGKRKTVAELFDRYAREVSSKKRGARWEIIRLERFKGYDLAALTVSKVTAADVASWRDQRLTEVKGASVRREMQLMSSAFNLARKEWGWMRSNPVADVRKPPQSPRRNRIATEREIEALGISAGSDLGNRTARAFHAFLWAIETGMRAGEILSLSGATVDVSRRVAHLPKTKNGEARDVPLSSRAVDLWEALPGDGFDLTSQQLDALWRKLRDRAGVEGLTFHDSRATAITRLSKKLDVLELARMVGHRDLKMLLVYYREPADEIAKRLD